MWDDDIMLLFCPTEQRIFQALNAMS